MDCQRVKPLLPGYLYKDLEEGEKQLVQAHLSGCTACQDDILSLKKTKEILECWPDEEVSSRMVFVEANQPWYKRIALPVLSLSVLRLRPLRTVAFGLAGLFVVLAAGNTRISYRQGDFDVDFRLVPRALTTGEDHSSIYAAIQAGEKKQMELVNRLVQESEARQLEELDRKLKQAAWALENRRQQDLIQVGQAFDQVRLETGNNLARTQRIMNDLMVLTGSASAVPVSSGRGSR